MNHMQALRIAEERSKKANEELAKIVKSNTTRLERDLNRQTQNVLRGFQKSLRSTLLGVYKKHTETLERKDLMIFILMIAAFLSLGINIAIAQMQSELINANSSALTNYKTMEYQGHTYAIVPANNILKAQDGQYMIRVR